LTSVKKIKKIELFAKKMRRAILEISMNCGESAHIGGALSMVEIMSCLYSEILKINIKKPRDRFILSKGHGFLGLLTALYLKKYIKKNLAYSFQSNGSEIIAHPIMNPSIGIESSNGSLGQGLSYAVGLAYAKKKKKTAGRTYVLIGDGECYEGAIWEAAITASELNLDNLIAIVDCNGHQNDGKIGNKMRFKSILKKWKGFEWNVVKCDGHKIEKLLKSLNSIKKNKPTVIIAKTIKGKGVPFMENNNDWHHSRVTKKIFDQAVKSL